MVSLADSLVASSSRPLSLHVRSDLTARRQRYQGRTYWVVKEPIGLRYFRFQEEDKVFDGPLLAKPCNLRFPPAFVFWEVYRLLQRICQDFVLQR